VEQLHSAEDTAILRRQCKAGLDAYRRRARADRRQFDYDLAKLLDLVRVATRFAYCGMRLLPTTFVLDHHIL
jgi:hypothetical protein